ncbi:MAG: hypothetical protein J0G30_03705 [Actinomycetales bacterium]|nr:hypothetical protein [Actinomycetales bacterium]
MSGFQARWLVVFWLGFASGFFLFVEASVAFSLGSLAFVSWVAMVFGFAAVLIAALNATRLARLGVSDLIFVKGTGTARAIAIGWGAVGLAIPVGVVVAVVTDLSSDEIVSPISGVIGTLGAVALLAMFGPGYGELREAMHHALDDESARGVREKLRARRSPASAPASATATAGPERAPGSPLS